MVRVIKVMVKVGVRLYGRIFPRIPLLSIYHFSIYLEVSVSRRYTLYEYLKNWAAT